MLVAIVSGLVGALFTAAIGIVAYVFRDSIRKWWLEILAYRRHTRQRPRIRVLHLVTPGSLPGFDFSEKIVEQIDKRLNSPY